MDNDLFSDFSVGGCQHSNPISPGGEAPSFAKDKGVFPREALERALRSGSRSRNFSCVIGKAVSKLSTATCALDRETKMAIMALASKCRSAVAVAKCLDAFETESTESLFEKIQKKMLATQKRIRKGEPSEKQKELLAVLTSGSRAQNFARSILEIVSKMPDLTNDSETYYVDCVLSLAAKCRCAKKTLSFFGLESEKIKKPPPKKRVKLSEEQRREKVKAERSAYKKRRRATDPSYKILCSLRKRLRATLKGSRKSDRTLVLLGCSLSQFCKHLEAQWQPGMSWDNYGSSGWHIDHIRPCASFDMSDPEEQKKCFHHTNLQPLWAKDNIEKGSMCNGCRICKRRKPKENRNAGREHVALSVLWVEAH